MSTQKAFKVGQRVKDSEFVSHGKVTDVLPDEIFVQEDHGFLVKYSQQEAQKYLKIKK